MTTHPIRGGLYGLLLGIGVAIYLIIFRIVSLGIVVPLIAIVVCIALGAAWGRFGPPTGPERPSSASGSEQA